MCFILLINSKKFIFSCYVTVMCCYSNQFEYKCIEFRFINRNVYFISELFITIFNENFSLKTLFVCIALYETCIDKGSFEFGRKWRSRLPICRGWANSFINHK